MTRQNEWNKKYLKNYAVVFRREADWDIIDWIEEKKSTMKTGEIFRMIIDDMRKEQEHEKDGNGESC